MKELKTFREFLNEEKFKQGDMVMLKGDDPRDPLKFAVASSRKMFASDLMAYTVVDKEGNTVEYSEDQLKLAEISFGAAGTDKRSGQVIGEIIQMIRDTGIDPSDVLEEVGQEFGIAFEFGRGH